MPERKIALFGGTFDPIHLGHCEVAGAAANEIKAEKVIFIPAKCSPLKGFAPTVSDEDRLRMITLTIADHKTFAVSNCELERPAPSFTLDTVRQFRREYGPNVSIHWLLGTDSVADLVYWHKIDDLIDECHLTTMQRAGYPPPNFDRLESAWGPRRVKMIRNNLVETPLIDISSTEIRRRLATGEDVSQMLHPDVIEYIRQRQLYQRKDPQRR